MHPPHTAAPFYTGTHIPAHGHHGHHGHHHPAPFPHHQSGHGFCPSCCHPVSCCVCHQRGCRKEAKELLVESRQTARDFGANPASVQKLKTMTEAQAPYLAIVRDGGTDTGKDTGDSASLNPADAERAFATAANAFPSTGLNQAAAQLGIETAFIGGGCCVHLSVEYTPTSPTAAGAVAVVVVDSEGTAMAWIKVAQPGSGYQVKECIVTTKPGANLFVLTVNMTARVRWCEVFSC